MLSHAKSLVASREAQTRQVIEDYVEARTAMDYPRISELLHPDARWIMPASCRATRFSGACSGRENICNLLREWDAQIQFFDAKVLDMLIDGNRGVTRWTARQRNRGTGATLLISGCGVFTQVDGLITEYYHYVDTAAINELAKR